MPERLILMRHAKSDYPPGVADHDRPLTARGRRDAAAAGTWLAQQRQRLVRGPLTVLVSSATRTQQTWTLAGDGFASGYVTEPRVYEASAGELLDLASPHAGTVLIVGHNPGLERVLHHLAPVDSPAARAAVKPCTIAALEVDGDWTRGGGSLLAFEVLRGDQVIGGDELT